MRHDICNFYESFFSCSTLSFKGFRIKSLNNVKMFWKLTKCFNNLEISLDDYGMRWQTVRKSSEPGPSIWLLLTKRHITKFYTFISPLNLDLAIVRSYLAHFDDGRCKRFEMLTSLFGRYNDNSNNIIANKHLNIDRRCCARNSSYACIKLLDGSLCVWLLLACVCLNG